MILTLILLYFVSTYAITIVTLLTIFGDKSNWDYIFKKKAMKKMLLGWKWPEVLLPFVSMLCQAWKAIPGSTDKEWATKLAINIE